MSARSKRYTFWGVVCALIVAGLAYAFKPVSVPVDLVKVVRAPLVVTVDEEAETRIRDVYVLSAPVTGVALRIEAEVGDVVTTGKSVLAEIEPVDPSFLDVRTESELRAELKAAEAAEALARAEVAEAEAELEFAAGERERTRKLFAAGHISERKRDDAERIYKARRAALDTTAAQLMRRRFEIEQAQARLATPEQSKLRKENCGCVPVIAPVSGRVLRVLHESEGVVQAGTPLVEIGDPQNLEVVADYLSTDAVKIKPGNVVIIEEWGGPNSLNGRVLRVEPYGFMKVSAMGIEEQRVNVIIDLTDEPEVWSDLGHGFRVEIKVVLARQESALLVPLTALFRHKGDWSVFVEREGRAELQSVEVGLRSKLEAEIISGLGVDDNIVRHPSSRVGPGTRIQARQYD